MFQLLPTSISSIPTPVLKINDYRNNADICCYFFPEHDVNIVKRLTETRISEIHLWFYFELFLRYQKPYD